MSESANKTYFAPLWASIGSRTGRALFCGLLFVNYYHDAALHCTKRLGGQLHFGSGSPLVRKSSLRESCQVSNASQLT